MNRKEMEELKIRIVAFIKDHRQTLRTRWEDLMMAFEDYASVYVGVAIKELMHEGKVVEKPIIVPQGFYDTPEEEPR